jgi:pSer/pThr/pTyr-binding forkhead associated (FHA) protein
MATAAPRTNAILKIKAAGKTRLIVFDTQDLSLGRANENDISVDDAEMSRKHAVFKRSREGCAVEDMGTSNGTARERPGVPRAVLKHGDVVKIGEVEITYAETTRAPNSLGRRSSTRRSSRRSGRRWRA